MNSAQRDDLPSVLYKVLILGINSLNVKILKISAAVATPAQALHGFTLEYYKQYSVAFILILSDKSFNRIIILKFFYL